MEGNRLLRLLVTVSLVGVVGLFAYSLSLEPVDRGIGDITAEDVGSLVSVNGMIATAWRTSRGDLNIILTDGEECIHVYVPEKNAPRDERLIPGTVVSVRGEVQIYAGELEIYVTSSTSIRIVKESTSGSIPPGVLAEMPDVFAGETLRVHGSVRNIHVLRDEDFQAIGTVFDLGADGYRISCMVFGWDWEVKPMGIAEGSTTVFEATWEYYAREAMWQLVSDGPSFGA
ncbi:MAG: OB-fold nucleic acid binding domain-containing protein [Thermoplasmata archaeon]|nr:OB-fold nucleic acid binding domain-containing protein [Thermoplasmata archaeon]